MCLQRIAPVLCIFVMLLLPLSSHAQWIDHFGVKGGITASSASDNMDQFDLERRSGWRGSAFAEKELLPFLSVRSEVGYTQRGFVESTAEVDVDGNETPLEATTRFDYLTIPLLAKLEYGVGAASLYALAGPRVDILVGREAGVFAFSGGDIESEIADFYDSTAAGGTLGVGVSTQMLPAQVFIEGRYDVDLTDSFPADAPRKVRNNAFALVLGVAF